MAIPSHLSRTSRYHHHHHQQHSNRTTQSIVGNSSITDPAAAAAAAISTGNATNMSVASKRTTTTTARTNNNSKNTSSIVITTKRNNNNNNLDMFSVAFIRVAIVIMAVLYLHLAHAADAGTSDGMVVEVDGTIDIDDACVDGDSSASCSAQDTQQQQQQPISETRTTENMTLKELYQHYNCQHIFSTPRPLYTESDWKQFRQIYRTSQSQPLQPNGKPGITTVHHDETNTPEHFESPTYSAQTTDGKGRGIFASRDIRKGERTYGGKANFAFFENGHSFRRYLNMLHTRGEEEGMACDIIKWAWPQPSMGDDYETLIVVVLDNNSLMNDGGKELANTGCLDEVEDEWDIDCGMFDEYALKDIKEGEEILCEYDVFLHEELWSEFGL